MNDEYVCQPGCMKVGVHTQCRVPLLEDPNAEVTRPAAPQTDEEPAVARFCGSALVRASGYTCGALAEDYDKDPDQERWYCRQHRPWSWMGTWEDVGWALKLTPRLTDAQWDVVNYDIDKATWNSRIGGYDINLTIKHFRRVLGTKNIEIVLPPVQKKKKVRRVLP